MPPNFESNYRMSHEELEQLLKPNLDSKGRNQSRLARFYDGRSVLVTGATGFVGRLLVEKLLRACVNIKRVYILVRAKRGKSSKERVQDLTKSIVFDGLRAMNINLDEKIVALEGDLTKDCFGLSQDLIKQLIDDELSCIFHSAASVNFQEPLRDATLTNVVGVLNSLRLAKKLPKLVALVYVSTAYSNCIKNPEISERVYPSDVDPMNLVELADILDRDSMEMIKEHLLGEYPNTYTYTKNLAESLCLSHSKDLPIVICRPSVVVCTWREPFPGFVDNINGGNGINYGPASGLSVTMQADNEIVLDYVPVDVVVNCIIALGWFCMRYHSFRALKMKKTNLPLARDNLILNDYEIDLNETLERFYKRFCLHIESCQLPKELLQVPVFHATSGMENPIKMSQFKNKMIAYANEYPTLQLFRRPRMTYYSSWHLFEINRLIQNKLIAKVMDYLQQLGCFKPEVYDKNDPIVRKKLVFRTERIDHFGQTIAYFLTRHWDFRSENKQLLFDEFMTDEDKRLFPFDMRKLNWDRYCEIYALGIRKFLLKEPTETLERARSRLAHIKFCQSFIYMLLIGALVYFCMILV